MYKDEQTPLSYSYDRVTFLTGTQIHNHKQKVKDRDYKTSEAGSRSPLGYIG